MTRCMLVLAVLAGCSHPPRKATIDPSRPPSVTLCRTTEAELRAALGEPTRDGMFHDARVVSWIVGTGHAGVIQYLAVMLDAQGVVVDRIWNLPTEIPWTPTDQCTKP